MRDANLFFDEALALTTSQVSTNIIPLGPLATNNARRNIGEAGNQLYLQLTVGTAFQSTGSSTLVATFQTDDATGFGSAATVFVTPSIPKASLTANATFIYPLPPGAYEDYARLSYTVGTADFTAGTLYAEITMNPQGAYYAYDSALSVA